MKGMEIPSNKSSLMSNCSSVKKKKKKWGGVGWGGVGGLHFYPSKAGVVVGGEGGRGIARGAETPDP